MTPSPRTPGSQAPHGTASTPDAQAAHRPTSTWPMSGAPRIDRRTGLRLAATGALGLATAGLAAGPAAATTAARAADAAGTRGGPVAPGALSAAGVPVRRPAPGAHAVVAVTATTVWTEPGLNRPGTDDPAILERVDLDAWNANLPDTESRRWLTGKLETQAVLGSAVIVDEIDGDWARIVVTAQPTPRDERGYPGWVPLWHLVVDEEFSHRARYWATATVTARTSTVTAGEVTLPVSFDTVLPMIAVHGESVEVAVPALGAASIPAADVVVRDHDELPPSPTVEDIIATGERFLGLRYLWAGVSAYGFDCSGFTYTLLRHHGITIARDAGPQRDVSGLAPVERADLQRGDLVFFSSGAGTEKIRHVAVFVGDDRILHAPNAARSVEIVSLTEYDTAGEYAGARRLGLAG